ncbi:MAG: PD40 domain-containing protein, partial [Halanaerobiales bacterium]|nr:PD40 domain-containing protein [Halanaerobiales bacterium]
LQVEFPDLEVGVWDIQVRARDLLNFDIYKGNCLAAVSLNSTTTATLNLDLTKGEISFLPTFRPEETITVTLNDLTSTITEELDSESHTVISDLLATSWQVSYEARDLVSGEVIATVKEYIDILPGRTITRKVTLNSEQEIIIKEETIAIPQKLAGYISNNDIVMVWEQGSYNDNVVGYLIYRSETETGQKSLLNSDLNIKTTYTDSTVDISLNYWYWVQAIDNIGNISDFSEPFFFGGIEQGYYQIFYTRKLYNKDSYQICLLEDMDSIMYMHIYSCLFPPIISPDIKKVAYLGYGSQNDLQELKILDIDDYTEKSVGEGNYTTIKWSPDSANLAYISGVRVSVADKYGRKLFDIFNPSESMDWSSDSNTILYNSFYDLYLTDLPGGKNDRLLVRGVDLISASWSPDGNRIAYISFEEFEQFPYKLYTLDEDGSNITKICSAQDLNNCIWSPDGSKIVVLYDNSIAVMNSDGSDMRVFDETRELEPRDLCWSPCGTQIIFSGLFKNSFIRDNYELARINVDGTGLVRLTYTPDYDEGTPLAGFFN